MTIQVTNYWKTSISRDGFYFEPFGVSSWWHKMDSYHHFTIMLLNFEISISWKNKGVNNE